MGEPLEAPLEPKIIQEGGCLSTSRCTGDLCSRGLSISKQVLIAFGTANLAALTVLVWARNGSSRTIRLLAVEGSHATQEPSGLQEIIGIQTEVISLLRRHDLRVIRRLEEKEVSRGVADPLTITRGF